MTKAKLSGQSGKTLQGPAVSGLVMVWWLCMVIQIP